MATFMELSPLEVLKVKGSIVYADCQMSLGWSRSRSWSRSSSSLSFFFTCPKSCSFTFGQTHKHNTHTLAHVESHHLCLLHVPMKCKLKCRINCPSTRCQRGREKGGRGSEIKRWRWRRGRPLLGILPASVPTRATNEIQSASTLPAISMSLKLSIFTYSESKLSHVFPLFTVHCLFSVHSVLSLP